MTLEEIFQNSGSIVGFRVRSVKTNNVLEVVSRTPKGKFVLQSITHPEKEESFANGNLDRYVLNDETTTARWEELNARAAALELEIDDLRVALNSKESEYDSIHDEMDELGGR